MHGSYVDWHLLSPVIVNAQISFAIVGTAQQVAPDRLTMRSLSQTPTIAGEWPITNYTPEIGKWQQEK